MNRVLCVVNTRASFLPGACKANNANTNAKSKKKKLIEKHCAPSAVSALNLLNLAPIYERKKRIHFVVMHRT